MGVYNPQGLTKAFWVTGHNATADALTAAMITAGVRLDESIVPDGITGFTSEGQTVDATPLSAKRERTVLGLATNTNGGIVLYRGNEAADDEADLFDEMNDAYGTTGLIVFVLNGSVATGELYDAFPSTINAVNASPPQGGQSARWMVGFAHPAEPSLNKPIAAP